MEATQQDIEPNDEAEKPQIIHLKVTPWPPGPPEDEDDSVAAHKYRLLQAQRLIDECGPEISKRLAERANT
jgi:hypothetical protein